eukprot:SAG11_NODE_650_length_7931_cov_9.512385_7_plen_259_part_00
MIIRTLCTDRVIGGLLGGYAVSHEPVLLQAAALGADAVLETLTTTEVEGSGWPPALLQNYARLPHPGAYEQRWCVNAALRYNIPMPASHAVLLTVLDHHICRSEPAVMLACRLAEFSDWVQMRVAEFLHGTDEHLPSLAAAGTFALELRYLSAETGERMWVTNTAPTHRETQYCPWVPIYSSSGSGKNLTSIIITLISCQPTSHSNDLSMRCVRRTGEVQRGSRTPLRQPQSKIFPRGSASSQRATVCRGDAASYGGT